MRAPDTAPHLVPVASGVCAVLDEEFEFEFLDPAGGKQRLPVTEVWSVPFDARFAVDDGGKFDRHVMPAAVKAAAVAFETEVETFALLGRKYI